MNQRQLIIHSLRAWYKAKDVNRQIEDKLQQRLIDRIQAFQGHPEQENCNHGCYGNSYGMNEDVCSKCFKILTDEDKRWD